MNAKRSIFKSKGIVVGMLLLLLEPAYFEQFNVLDKVYTYGSFVCTLVLIGLLFFVRIHKAVVWTIVFYGCVLISTILGSGLLYQYMKANFASLAMCLMFYIWLEKNPELLIECFSIYEIFVYINLLTLIIYPTGLYSNGMYTQCWFLGYKNPQIRTILPIVCMSLIRSYRKYGNISVRTICLLICTAITFILNDSATSLVGFAVFLGLVFLFHSKNKQLPKMFTLMNGVIVSIIAFFAIIIFQMQYLFAGIIENVLGRNLTFTTRVRIWSRTLALIKEKPILGYGYKTGSEYCLLYNSRYATHPHNYYMYILMTGGFVLAVVLLVGFYIADKKLKETTETSYSKIILFTIFAFLIMGLTESLVSTVLLYPMLILAMESDKIAALGYAKKSFTIFGWKVKFRKRPNFANGRGH